MPINFDLERMRKSINSGTVSFPRGLGRSRQQYLRDNNRQFGNSFHPDQYHAAEIVRGLLM